MDVGGHANPMKLPTAAWLCERCAAAVASQHGDPCWLPSRQQMCAQRSKRTEEWLTEQESGQFYDYRIWRRVRSFISHCRAKYEAGLSYGCFSPPEWEMRRGPPKAQSRTALCFVLLASTGGRSQAGITASLYRCRGTCLAQWCGEATDENHRLGITVLRPNHMIILRQALFFP